MIVLAAFDPATATCNTSLFDVLSPLRINMCCFIFVPCVLKGYRPEQLEEEPKENQLIHVHLENEYDDTWHCWLYAGCMALEGRYIGMGIPTIRSQSQWLKVKSSECFLWLASVHEGLIDWLKVLFHLTQTRSFRSGSSQPVTLLSTEKLNLTQRMQTCIHNKVYYNKIDTQNNYMQFWLLLKTSGLETEWSY